MNARRVTLLALSALPLLACTQPTSEDVTNKTTSPLAIAEPDVAFDPDLTVAPPPPDLSVTTLETGDGWRRIRVAGKATDYDTSAIVAVDRELVVITDKTKISTAPVASFVKSEIESELTAAKTTTYLAAGALPEGEEADIIDPVTAAEAETAMASGTTTAMLGCTNEEKTFSKTLSTTRTFSHTKGTESGTLTGSIGLSATLAASGTGKVTIKVHRAAWALCKPYKVSFRRASFAGSANVTATVNVDATIEKPWKYDKKLAQPPLGTLAFSIGPVPVTINFSAPIHVGVEAAAKATLRLEATGVARTNLDYSCTTGGCGGSKSASFSWSGGPTPTVGVIGKVDVTPYAYAGVHANLYADWVANAEIGVKAKVKGELWGYSGYGCGDGDFNGSNEYVTATALDTRFGIDLVGKASVATRDFGPWPYNLYDKHIAFYDLASSTAMAPMLNAKSNMLGSTTIVANGRMRPCWPWTDKMKYRLNYNDGSSEEFWDSPTTVFSKLHTYSTFGSKLVSLTAIVDEQGRTPGKTTNDTVYLSKLWYEPILVSSKLSL